MRAEVVQCVVGLTLGGCLAAPPPAGEEGTGGDRGAPDGAPPGEGDDAGQPVAGCEAGNELDLAYVSWVGVEENAGASHFALADMAVVVNPGPAPLETAFLAASITSDAAIGSEIHLAARDGRLALPASQAHGALGVSNAALVLTAVPEEWTDDAYPALALGFSLGGPLLGETHVVLDVFVDDYHFKAPITLVPGGAFPGEPLEADRITARCGE